MGEILACARPQYPHDAAARPAKVGRVAYPFVESPNFTRAAGRAIDVVVMHTMEIAERPDAAEICARWFRTPVSQVSAHYCVDADSIVQCVWEKDVAWHARGGNANSIGVELGGFAGQTTTDWEDTYSATVLERAATLVADVCRRRRIPVRWLDADDLRAGRPGLTGHSAVSRAFRKSDHWDPGDGFPVEAFVDRVRVLEQAQRRAVRAARARA
jgi:N-acetyl-anhydromuramyl-L-alanine amidase AmpD